MQVCGVVQMIQSVYRYPTTLLNTPKAKRENPSKEIHKQNTTDALTEVLVLMMASAEKMVVEIIALLIKCLLLQPFVRTTEA